MLIKVDKYIKKHQLLNHSERIIVGLSGGADSVALLHLLIKLNYDCIGAHCNFHLRGEESDRDEAFVTRIAAEWNIPLFKIDFNTTQIASERKISIEMAARDLRYEWFEKIRIQEQSQAICVAHHQDDNVETMLINLIRGTGIRGLSGMRLKNNYVVRPFLELSQKEILDYIKEEGLSYVTDSTNMETDIVRNKIRLEVLPLLESINPSVKDSLVYTMENLDSAKTVYEKAIETQKSQVFNPQTGVINIDCLKSCYSPEAMLYEILRDYHFNREVIRKIWQAIDTQSGKEFYSPTHRLVKDRDNFLLLPLLEHDTNEYTLSESTEELIDPLPMQIKRKSIDSFQMIYSGNIACLDADQLQFPLKLRRWKEGDRFMPFGMNNFQKLSDFFNNNKFSKPQKETTWLLTSGTDIVWLIGYRIDNRYKITEQTKNVIILEVR